MSLSTLILPFDTGAYGKPLSTILNGITDGSVNSNFAMVQGDILSLVLYPRAQPTSIGGPTSTVELPTGCSIVVSGKLLSDPGADTLLFEAASFTAAEDGESNYIYTGTLDLNTSELSAAISATTLSIPVLLIIDVIDSDGNPKRYLAEITIWNQGYSGSEGSPSPATPSFLGSQAISEGASSVTVTGQSWGTAPAAILPGVMKDGASADNIFATVDSSSITSTGFTAYLSGAPSDSTHTLIWQAIPAI